MFKTLNGRPTDKMSVRRPFCTVLVRFVSVLYPLRVRYTSVGGLEDKFTIERTSTGRLTDKMDVERTRNGLLPDV